MTKESNRLRELFDRALQFSDETERSLFIDEICRDNLELKQKLEKLVEAYFEAGSFLDISPEVTYDRSPDSVPTANAQAEQSTLSNGEAEGSTLGPYLLKKKIGEGGYGVVYAAEQLRPVRRDVAVKLIKPGMDSREVIARFNLERQALAVMEHPSIATILDAGTADSGSPYFVMELVDGTSITQYCDRYRLTLRERLELFILVCNGVQHAHQKGVIHRDLKPGNILVTRQDSKPQPKIIDFGIAKAMDHMSSYKTQETGRWQLVGTPIYMSPEQAASKNKLIDARSDIYSLGVLLYELLTGQTPISSDELSDLSFSEFIQKIKTGDTPRPSSQLSSSNTNLEEVAKKRQVTPKRLRNFVVGDLDWIVAKALERDIDQRYESAGALGRDIERFIDNDPIDAGPPSATYRIRKFVRKHWVSLATATAFAAVLVTATTVSIIQAMNATHNAGVAKAALDAESEALAAEAVRRKQFEDSLEFMMATYRIQQPTGFSPKLSILDILDIRKGAIQERFNDDPETKVKILVAIADSYNFFGFPEFAEEVLTEALQICESQLLPSSEINEARCSLAYSLYKQHRFREVVRVSNEVQIDGSHLDDEQRFQLLKLAAEANYSIGQYQEAIQLAERVLAMGASHPSTGNHRIIAAKAIIGKANLKLGNTKLLAEVTREIGDSIGAVDVQRYPATLDTLAVFAQEMFDDEQSEAEALVKRILSVVQERYGKQHRFYIFFYALLADMDSQQVRTAEAIRKRTELIDIIYSLEVLDLATVVSMKSRLGRDISRAGSRDQGLKLLEEAYGIAKTYYGTTHEITLTAEFLLANCLEEQDQAEKALGVALSALKLSKENLHAHNDLTRSCLSLVADIYGKTGRDELSIQYLEELADSQKKLFGEYSLKYLDSVLRLSKLYASSEEPERGVELAEKYFDMARQHYGTDHRLTWMLSYAIGFATAKAGRPEEAIQILERTLENQKRLLPENDPDILFTLLELGTQLAATGNERKALNVGIEAFEIAKKAWGARLATAVVVEDVVEVANKLGDREAAISLYEELLEIELEYYRDDSFQLVRTQQALSMQYIAAGQFDNAEKSYDQMLLRLRTHFPRHERLIVHHAWAGKDFRVARQFRQAHKFFEQAITVCKKYAPDTRLQMNLQMDSGYALYQYVETLPEEHPERDAMLELVETRLLASYQALNEKFSDIPDDSLILPRRELKLAIAKMYDMWGEPKLAEEWREK